MYVIIIRIMLSEMDKLYSLIVGIIDIQNINHTTEGIYLESMKISTHYVPICSTSVLIFGCFGTFNA